MCEIQRMMISFSIFPFLISAHKYIYPPSFMHPHLLLYTLHTLKEFSEGLGAWGNLIEEIFLPMVEWHSGRLGKFCFTTYAHVPCGHDGHCNVASGCADNSRVWFRSLLKIGQGLVINFSCSLRYPLLSGPACRARDIAYWLFHEVSQARVFMSFCYWRSEKEDKDTHDAGRSLHVWICRCGEHHLQMTSATLRMGHALRRIRLCWLRDKVCYEITWVMTACALASLSPTLQPISLGHAFAYPWQSVVTRGCEGQSTCICGMLPVKPEPSSRLWRLLCCARQLETSHGSPCRADSRCEDPGVPRNSHSWLIASCRSSESLA